MSDMEEPPAKVLKMEAAPSSLDSTMEGQEEGQEEWLSEGVLTDDDYMATNATQESVAPDMNATADSAQSMDLPQEEPTQTESSIKMEQNIEDTLNNFEGMETSTKQEDAFDELLKKEEQDARAQPERQSEDDGNDTDDLLRMLGEGDGKKKKVVTSSRERSARRDQRSSDDEYLLEGAKVTKLTVAKNAIIRKHPIKAEPEDMSDRDSDMSDEDASTAKRVYSASRRTPLGARAPKSRSFISNNTDKPKPTQLKQYNSSILKSLLKPQDKSKEHPETKDEEFLDGEDDDLDEDLGDDSSIASAAKKSQPIRRPERMDEEVPSDEESQSDDDSLYDIMGSSDSEDMDDWFNLDIRAERAGDYLPWLGDKAHKLLTEEKHRVTARLAALRQSVTALQSSSRVQNDQIKVATEALRELDAMLTAG